MPPECAAVYNNSKVRQVTVKIRIKWMQVCWEASAGPHPVSYMEPKRPKVSHLMHAFRHFGSQVDMMTFLFMDKCDFYKGAAISPVIVVLVN